MASSQYLNLPDDWKTNPAVWPVINAVVYGSPRDFGERIMSTNKAQVEKMIAQRLEKASSLEDVVKTAASGGGLTTDAPTSTLSLVGILNDLKPILNDSMLKVLEEKTQEAQRILVDLGGKSMDEAQSLVTRLSDRNMPQDINENEILDNFRNIVTERRQILDLEADLRNGRDLSPGSLETMRSFGLDPNDPDALSKIQSTIQGISGLESARQASIDANKSRVDIQQQEDQALMTGLGRDSNLSPDNRFVVTGVDDQGRVLGDFAVNRQSEANSFDLDPTVVEKASIITGVDVDRVQTIQDNIKQYMIQTGSSLSAARDWALQGKDPRSPEFQAVNLVIDGAMNAFKRGDVVDQLGQANQRSQDAIDRVIEDMIGDDDVLAKITDQNVLPRELTDAQLKELTSIIRKKVGSPFDEKLQRAIEDHNVTKRFARENLDQILTKTDEDLSRGIKRIDEDTALNLRQVQGSLAQRGLSRGGTRKRQEGLIEQQRQRSVEDVSREARRVAEQATTRFAREFGTRDLDDVQGRIARLGASTANLSERGVQNISQSRLESDIKKAREEAVDVALKQDIGNLRSLRLSQTF